MTSKPSYNGNVVAERALLGGLLRSPDTFWQIVPLVRHDQFSIVLHQQIFSAINSILHENKRLSFQQLETRLPPETDDGTDMAGFLGALLKSQEESGPPADYVDAVVDAWTEHTTINMLSAALKDVKSKKRPVVDVLSDVETHSANIASASNDSPIMTLGEIVDRALVEASEAYRDQDFKPGYDTGLPSVDEVLGPIRRGRVYFLGGAEKSGKTILAAQILARVALSTHVLMAQGEMHEREIAFREISRQSQVETDKIETGAFNMAEWEAVNEAKMAVPRDTFHFWRMPDGTKISNLRHKCMDLRRRVGTLGLLVVDHLLLVNPDKDYENEFRGIAEVVKGLKRLALDVDTAVLCMTHRTRGSQDRNDPTPWSTDFYGGGVIERTCDALICLFSRHRWLSLRKPENRGAEALTNWGMQLSQTAGKVQFALLTHRHASYPHIRDLTFNGALAKFGEPG